jgi:hypothetical protein
VRRALLFVTLVGGLAQCSGSDVETACRDAQERLGYRVCVHSVPDVETWAGISLPAAAVDQSRATVYLVPARDDAPLPTVFVDAGAVDHGGPSLHFEFLTAAVPDYRFLDYDQYLELILDPGRREWFGGSLSEYVAAGRDPIFGFTIADWGDDPSATITCSQFNEVYDVLSERVRVGDVAVVPSNQLQRDTLASCGAPVHDPATALAYEVYSDATGCGTLRRFTLAELAVAEENAELGWQDVLVTDEAPLDIETVIAGIVTGTRQGELAHLNVRSAARGTPNCYVRGAYDLLAEHEGQLVELTCGATEATVAPISPEDAERCWDGFRPDPATIAPADVEWAELVALLDLPTADAAERSAGVSRFGAKGANLAVLYQRIDAALQLDGFLIPFRYYDEFMRTSGFAETLEGHLADPLFLTDGAARREQLAAVQAAMRDATCDPAVVDAIEAMVLETFGADDVMVRFRSSSNAEDALEFSGAGLYDSTSVCVADETDGDTVGPSRCDPDEPDERGVCRGLTKVWASLWNMEAYEERAWYGIDQRQVAMAVLVDTRIKDELANVVAFSGNPLAAGDQRYLVNAQIGELDVVSAASGVWPESDLLTIQEGAVADIERVRGSSELPDGQWVLDDERLQELGAALSEIVSVYPIDDVLGETDVVLLDTEWKIDSDGQLIVKQVRLFLE